MTPCYCLPFVQAATRGAHHLCIHSMLNLFHRFLSGDHKRKKNSLSLDERLVPSELLLQETDQRFPFSSHLKICQNFPRVDWGVVQSWVESIEDKKLRGNVWASAENAWLLHLQAALGDRYSLTQSETAMLLSPLEKNVAAATLDYMSRTLKRVVKVLDGIAEVAPWGKDILIVFETEDEYYNYVSYYYPEEGEFAFSGGMFISEGCAHFVTVQSDLRTVEPVIAHEMTHACLSHLTIPLWLNEGLAVNTEHRFTGKPPSVFSAQEMRAKHLAFWGVGEVQEFWSGKSFSRTDDGNMLSYDLAKILVETFAKDWASFREFVLTARWQDGGAEAAQRYLGTNLGDYVSSFLEKPSSVEFEPNFEELEKQQTSAAPADLPLNSESPHFSYLLRVSLLGKAKNMC